MTTNLNGHELPINKMAAFSYAKGCEYKVSIPEHFRVYIAPPKTVPFSGPKEKDLTGEMVSRLKVIGFAGNKKWVVRCKCGNYEIRNGKNLRKLLAGKGNCEILACFECMRFADKKRHYDFMKYGHNKYKNLDHYLK